MNKQYFLFIGITLMLIFYPYKGYTHEIYLKNGRVIDIEDFNFYEEDNEITYYRYGAKITIERTATGILNTDSGIFI
jgi:hypothetical protein